MSTCDEETHYDYIETEVKIQNPHLRIPRIRRIATLATEIEAPGAER